MAEVDTIARSSLQQRPMDPLPYLSRMPGGGSNLASQGGFLGGLSGTQIGNGVMPRVQESRQARRQQISPLARPANLQQSCLSTPAKEEAHFGTLPAVQHTPSTEDELDRPSSDVHAAAPAVSEAEVPVSQDEAASLLLALPMSRADSGLCDLSLLPGNGNSSPRVGGASPRVMGAPMTKNISGLSVSGCLSLLDEADPSVAQAQASPRAPVVVPSPHLSGLPMSKTASTVSVSGFLTHLED